MTKSKKNRKLSLLLILAIISLVVLLSSFARYTGVAGEETSTAKVAKWSVSLKNGSSKIFNHSYTTNLKPYEGTAGNTGDYIIAPGVSGAYEITIKNDGDVAAKISALTIVADAGNAAVPIQYKTTESGTAGDLATAVAALSTAVSNQTIQPGQEVTVGTLYWEWPYTAATPNTDAKDTQLGVTSATQNNAGGERTSYALNMSITAEQVAPTK